MQNYEVKFKVISESHYAALVRNVRQKDIPKEIPPLGDVLIEMLKQNNIKVTGDFFFRYLSCTSSEQMTIEVGLPIEKTDAQPDGVVFKTFPPGKYLSVIHMGDYSKLIDAHMFLEKYSKENNLVLDERRADTIVEWGCRAEIYVTEPDSTPIEEWKTEVLFLLK